MYDDVRNSSDSIPLLGHNLKFGWEPDAASFLAQLSDFMSLPLIRSSRRRHGHCQQNSREALTPIPAKIVHLEFFLLIAYRMVFRLNAGHKDRRPLTQYSRNRVPALIDCQAGEIAELHQLAGRAIFQSQSILGGIEGD